MKPTRTPRRLLLICCLALATIAGSAPAQEQSLAPGINRHYQDPDYDRWVNTFESPGREVYDRRHEIVSALALRPGMDVADVGAGTGLFTLLFAEEVSPDGRVYAVDIAENFVRAIDARARETGHGNVTALVGTAHSAGLPPRSVDLVFICDTYHHFEYPRDMLESIRTALRPGGKLAVIDFRKDPETSSGWVMGHVRANEQTVIDEISASGFALAHRPTLLTTNYFLVFDLP